MGILWALIELLTDCLFSGALGVEKIRGVS